jgi:glycosyltransferase involved in cell wall biosynthesis
LIPSISVVIPARNEARYLDNTLRTLFAQTWKPSQVILIDDASNDQTGDIAKKFGCDVVRFPYNHTNWIATPKLARVKNLGFAQVNKNTDFLCVLGADHLIPRMYLEKIITRMQEKPKTVIASGVIQHEWTVAPRGSGRIINGDFWRYIGSRYPENWGYESYPLYRAMFEGFDVTVYNDIVTETQRPTSSNYKPIMSYRYGKAMKALGYGKNYAFGRCLVIGKRKGIQYARQMWDGYNEPCDTPYEEPLRKFVNTQHKITIHHFGRLIKYVFNAKPNYYSKS